MSRYLNHRLRFGWFRSELTNYSGKSKQAAGIKNIREVFLAAVDGRKQKKSHKPKLTGFQILWS